jgi:hypothetical protein
MHERQCTTPQVDAHWQGTNHRNVKASCVNAKASTVIRTHQQAIAQSIDELLDKSTQNAKVSSIKMLKHHASIHQSHIMQRHQNVKVPGFHPKVNHCTNSSTKDRTSEDVLHHKPMHITKVPTIEASRASSFFPRVNHRTNSLVSDHTSDNTLHHKPMYIVNAPTVQGTELLPPKGQTILETRRRVVARATTSNRRTM